MRHKCSVCGGDQHSLRESATCDWVKNHKGKTTDKRTPKVFYAPNR